MGLFFQRISGIAIGLYCGVSPHMLPTCNTFHSNIVPLGARLAKTIEPNQDHQICIKADSLYHIKEGFFRYGLLTNKML